MVALTGLFSRARQPLAPHRGEAPPVPIMGGSRARLTDSSSLGTLVGRTLRPPRTGPGARWSRQASAHADHTLAHAPSTSTPVRRSAKRIGRQSAVRIETVTPGSLAINASPSPTQPLARSATRVISEWICLRLAMWSCDSSEWRVPKPCAIPVSRDNSGEVRTLTRLLERLVEKERNFARLGVDAGLEVVEVPLHASGLIGQLQTGEHGDTAGIGVGGL